MITLPASSWADSMATMKIGAHLKFSIFLTGLFLPIITEAQAWLDEGAREFEELHLQQLQTVQINKEISPFTTDGCSGFQSQNWKLLAKTLPGFEKQFGNKPPWEYCCVEHDKAYWHGETVNGYAKRKRADQILKQCVIDTGSTLSPQLSSKFNVSEERLQQLFSTTAELMHKAVRLGGLPCTLLPWRWGYGWNNCAFSAISSIPDHHSDVKDDEYIRFFNTTAWLDDDKTHWNIPIHAWIYEPEHSEIRINIFAALLSSKFDLRVTSDTKQNFHQRSNLIIADNERGKRIVIRLAGKDFTLPVSKENGHAQTVIKLPLDVASAFSNGGRLLFFAITAADDLRQFEGDVQLVSDSGISVISDIDDTVKITNVRDRYELINNTFFKDFKEAPGMADLYQNLDTHGVSIHYVSSSPWQLYSPLQEFMQKADFPRSSMNLKNVRFRDNTFQNLFKKGTDTKPKQIEPILKRYPDRQFILIGDSGEQDPEVYGDIATRYPSQIQKILIRKVDNSDKNDERYRKAFKNIAGDQWQLFNHPDEIDVILLLMETDQIAND